MLGSVGGVDLDVEKEAKAALDSGDTRRMLEILMEGYGNAVYRYCYRMMRNADDAQDVCQTTFLQAFQSCRGLQPRVSIRAWLFGITYHRCIDALNTRRRKEDVCDPLEDAEEMADLAQAPEDAAAARERQIALTACLDELKPEVRAALLLRYQQQFSYPEITAICGVHVATLQARVTRAMPLLRQCLERKGIRE